MTPLPTAARYPHETQTYPGPIRATDSTSLSPPIPQAKGKYNTATSHKKQASITSNPVQASTESHHQEYFQDLVQTPGAFDQPQSLVPDYMSGAYALNHELNATAQQAYAFDELMTPETSDNQISEHTTPQELIWEQQFLQQEADSAHILQPPEFGSPRNPQSPSNDFNAIFTGLDQAPPKYITGAQLLSPELLSSSIAQNSAQPLSQVQSMTPAIPMSNTTRKRGAGSLQVATNHLGHAHQSNGHSPHQRPVSPSVVVTSHTRGDSPARIDFPRARSSSKRSRESGLHHSSDHDERSTASRSPHLSPIDQSTSRLMPPDPFDSTNYDDDVQDRSGVIPGQRGTEQVTTVNELADQRQISEKNAVVEDWLSKSETGSAADEAEAPSRGGRGRSDRPRAHSTGILVDAMGLPIYSDRNVPGPGVLVDEDSQDEYSEDGSTSLNESNASEQAPPSPPVSPQKLEEPETTSFPPLEADAIPPEQQEPLPKQFFRRTPWEDSVRGPITNTRDQPGSSNAAASRFNQEAAKWETASRAATWGTRRRLSEGEVSAIVDGSRVRHLSLAKRGRERGNTLLNKARGLIPRRSNSNIKKGNDSPPKVMSPEPESLSRTNTAESVKPVSRISSFGRQKSLKSPTPDTSGAFVAMTGNLTAVGQGSSSTMEPASTKSEGLRSPLQMLKKVRSKSDAGKSPSRSGPGLAELITRHGGPPMPTLASPAQTPYQPVPRPRVTDPYALDDDDEDDELLEEIAVKMDFKIGAENIIPNYEGFKIHARQLNPRLEPYLIDRVGQEQVRRYKKLVDNKIKHTKAVQISRKCTSGKHCFGLGGEATLLPPRVSARDPDAICAQFQIANHEEEEINEVAFEEGVVTPALFPPGIPLPPVKRLPAEFECILCFKVKRFQKPSDWTKHVHEDIQPFSCTFPNCNEPKSFKRKADWVRHENERHRRLEYWKCNVQECSHVCYRKDNFVQHLVREHKKMEPKMKGRGSGTSKINLTQDNRWPSEDNELWHLVDTCRFETSSKPRDEPCRFCGNICTSWKKLSVHMGKHMEQIAMPVLELVNMREVAPDTIISPVAQSYQQTTGATVPTMMNRMDPRPSLSPFTHSANSYQNSSAGQSPTVVHSSMQYGYDPGFYSNPGLSTPAQGPRMQSEAYTNTSMYTAHTPNIPTGLPASDQFGSISTHISATYPGQATQTPNTGRSMQTDVPRSQPMQNGYHNNAMVPSVNVPYDPSHVNYTSSPEMSPYHQYSATGSQSHGFQDSPEHTTSRSHFDPGSHHDQNGYLYTPPHLANASFHYP